MKQLNLGLIGLGIQGKIHLKNCLHLKGARLVAVADRSKSAIQFAKKAGVKNLYKDYDKLLKDQKIDAVIIALPNFLHSECATKAAEAGKDIFLEKPLARNVEEGEDILSSARKNGVKLMLGYDLRFNDALSKLREEIVDGIFGEVQIVEATNISSGPFSPRADQKGPSPVPSWWFEEKLTGGGALLDLGSHLINLLIWYFGDIIDVKSYLGYRFNMDFEDLAMCILRFKNGPIATIKAGWFSKDFQQSIQVCGTAKNLWMRISPLSKLGIVWRDIKTKFGKLGHSSNYRELAYFIECLQSDVSPVPSGEEGLMDLRVISMAYKNAFKLS